MQDVNAGRLIEALEAERKRLARDIHDGPAQSLTNAAMRLEVIKKLLESGRIADGVREIERLQDTLRNAVNDIRRMISDLRPNLLEQGVENAIVTYADRFSQMSAVPVIIKGKWLGVELSQPEETAVFRMVQESLNNIYKHARASHVEIELSETEHELRIRIIDDGIGFDQETVQKLSFGLQGMRERAQLIHGQVDIASGIGHGTTVAIVIPKGKHV